MSLEIYHYDAGTELTAQSFNFEAFWTAVNQRFNVVTVNDVDIHMRKSNNLRRALQMKAALSPTKRGGFKVPINVAAQERSYVYVDVYAGEHIEPDMFTYRRFMACIAMKAIEVPGDFVNPLAERAGFKLNEGRVLYTVFAAGGEFLFFKYPYEVAALTCWRTEHYNELGIKVDRQADVFNTLSRQTCDSKVFCDWLSSCDKVKLKQFYDVLNVPREQGRAIAGRSQRDFDAILSIVHSKVSASKSLTPPGSMSD